MTTKITCALSTYSRGCFAALLAFALVLPTGATAQSAETSATIKARMLKMEKSRLSCTKYRKEVRKLRKEYPEYHFAFAGRKAATITGIKGCGYAWNVSKAEAYRVAMKFCKEAEQTYGTNGGKFTCRFMK